MNDRVVRLSGDPPTDFLAVGNGDGTFSLATFGGGAGGAWHQISRLVADGTLGTYDFNPVPQTYNALQLRIRGRTTEAVVRSPLYLRFNNDSAADYDYLETWSTAAGGASVAGSVGQTRGRAGDIAGANSNAVMYGSSVIDILDYASALGWKTWQTYSVTHELTTTTPGNMAAWYRKQDTGEWRSAAAIARITVLLNAGLFVSGSTLTLYGLT